MPRTRTRIRSVVVLFVLAVLTVGVAVLAVADPFHLRHARWFTAGLVLLALVLLTVALAAAMPLRGLRWVVLVLGAAAVAGWVAIVLLATRVDDDSRVTAEVADGDRRLVVLEGGAFSIDPVFAVALRAGSGPFEQETLVYQGLEDSPAPSEVRFVDGDTVEVRTAGGCSYLSEVEAITLEVDPVHRPRAIDAC